jgi:Tol biopolymer transport system component
LAARVLPASSAPRAVVRVVAHRAEFETRHAADGQRLYFVERNSFLWTLAQVPADGGPVTRISTPFWTPTIFDIDPKHSQLLLGNDANRSDQQLWTMPATGGAPRRVGALTVRDAAWSADGRWLVYTIGPKLYTAHADGSGSREIAKIDCDYLDWPRWSPDEKTIRVTANFPRQITTAIWEVGADGAHPHRWLPEWKADRTCCGSWIDGGRWYVFQARVNAIIEIWARREKNGWFQSAAHVPVQLTAGPDFMSVPTGSLSSSRIYALDQSAQGELNRYDAHKDIAEPYLKGVSARYCAFSRDGKWAAYVTFPARQLWRSRLDGSDAVQLTTPPFRPLEAQWSADGTRIFSIVDQPGARSRLYSIGANGEPPERVVKGSGTESSYGLSPDGKTLVFARADASGNPATSAVWLYRLDTRSLTQLEGSAGLTGGPWSPDGRYIAAVRPFPDNTSDLYLWDFHNRSWKRLIERQWIQSPTWSQDSKSISYGCQTSGHMDAVCRIGIPQGKVETVAPSWRFHRADTSHSSFAGLAPDGSPLFLQIYKDFDVASIDLEGK